MSGTNRDQPADDGLTPRQLGAWVDASRGGFYEPGGAADLVTIFTDEHEEDVAHPLPEERATGFLDPRALRFHDLQRDVPGTDVPDRRLAPQIVNDWEGPYSPARPGDAPFGQPELFTSLNRSTREVDLFGRVALPSSMRRPVGSEDGRYVLALAITAPRMDPIAYEEEEGDSGGTRTRQQSALDRHGHSPRAEFAEGRIVDEAEMTVAGAVERPRARPFGYFVDEWGDAALLGTVLSASLGPRLYTGRDGNAIRMGVIRADAHVATAGPAVPGSDHPGLSGPVLYDARDAGPVPDNDPGRDWMNAGAGGLLNPPRPVKGSMWFDRKPGRVFVGETSASAKTGLSASGQGRDGVWRTVVFVRAEDVTDEDREKLRKPPKGDPKPPKPPKNPPPFIPGEGEEVDPDEITPGPQVGPFAGPDIEQIIDELGGGPQTGNFTPGGPFGFTTGAGDPTRPGGPGSPWLWDPSEIGPATPGGGAGGSGTGGTGFVDGGGTPGAGTGPATGDDGPGLEGGGGGGIQERDYEGTGAPCFNAISSGIGNPGYLPVEQVDDTHVRVGDETIEVVPTRTNPDVPFSGPDRGFGPGIDAINRRALDPGGGLLGADLFAGGGKTIANVLVPPLGAPGGPKTVRDAIALTNLQQRAQGVALQSLLGGPGYYGGNLGVQHVNTPGNPPTPSRIGARWAATPGQELLVERSVVEHVQVLEAPEGSTIVAKGPGVHRVARELRGEGRIRDERPLVQLDGGGAEGGLIASPEGFGVDRLARVQSRGLRIQDAPTDAPPLAIYRGNRPAWAVAPDGVQRHQQLEEHPTRPGDPSEVRTYVKDGSLFVQTSTGETQLGAGGGGGDVDEIVVASPLTGGGTGTVNIGLGTVPVSKGGTGAVNAANARDNLGLELGVDVQEHSAALDAFAALGAGMDGQVLTWDTGAFGWADLPSGAGLDVEEEDGAPSVTASVLKFPNGTLVDNGGGSVSALVQKSHQNLTDLSGLTLGADQMLYVTGAGALASAGVSSAFDDLFGASGEGFIRRNASGGWSSPGTSANQVLGANSSGVATYFTVGSRKMLATLAANQLQSTGQLDLTVPNGVGFGELESTDNANAGSFQLNLDMVTTSGSTAAGAQSQLALKLNGATLNVFKIRADGVGGTDVFFLNISGTTSNFFFDDSNDSLFVGYKLEMPEQSDPGTPAAGKGYVYLPTSGQITSKNDAGTKGSVILPQTAPSSAVTNGDTPPTASGWSDATAAAQFDALSAVVASLKGTVNTNAGVANDTISAAQSATLFV